MTETIYDQAPAAYDIGQITALAQTRFGAALRGWSEYRPGGPAQIAVYLTDVPNAGTRTAWTNDLTTYAVSHPSGDDIATNRMTVDNNLAALITSLQADVTQDNTIITNANTVIATTGTLTTLQLSNFVRQLAQAVKTLASNDINNKRAFANALRKLQGDYTDLTGT